MHEHCISTRTYSPGGRDIKAKDAMSHVFGYTIANDVTARDLQKKHLQWFKGTLNIFFCYLLFCFLQCSDYLELKYRFLLLFSFHAVFSYYRIDYPIIKNNVCLM